MVAAYLCNQLLYYYEAVKPVLLACELKVCDTTHVTACLEATILATTPLHPRISDEVCEEIQV